uniref:Heat shock protein 70 n=1 Tax=Panagrolaimus superbus TaxID=310955 RepID=A0A914YS66_9BILA
MTADTRPVIGIDLGTSCSRLGIFKDGKSQIIANHEGDRSTPSWISFSDDGEVHVELSAHVLRQLKNRAEEYCGCPITDAVITVPAYFSDSQRKATKIAAEIAGLNVLRLINEPNAAAIAYCLEKKKDSKVLVYNFGGGTLDVSILIHSIDDNTFKVQATSGNTHLGGKDIDNLLADYCITEFYLVHKIDVKDDPSAMARIREACEKAKHALSTAQKYRVVLPNLVDKVTCDITVAKMKMDEIDDVVLVGGSTRIPKIRELLKGFFGDKQLSHNIDPDEAVALGATIYAAVLAKVEDCKNVRLVDIISRSLGINTHGGIMSPLIFHGTHIPTRGYEIYTTIADDQEIVPFKIYEGEATLTQDNRLLGEFDFTGIPRAPKKVLEFSLPVEKSTGNKQNFAVKDKNACLTSAEIEKVMHAQNGSADDSS